MTDKELELKAEIEREGKLPRHVAIIMDGNGRWAKARHLPRLAGHRAGVEPVRESVRACAELGIEVLTLYAFSSENWSRPKAEVHGLMQVLKETLRSEQEELNSNRVRLRTIGRIEDLPADVQRQIDETSRALEHNDGLILNLALSYGGRPEIVQAVRRIAEAVRAQQLDPASIDERLFSRFLYTADLPDPDLLIRTSGEYRVSNFLLWQIAYAELWVTSVAWPEFRREHLYLGIREFQGRDRRFGRVEGVKAALDQLVSHLGGKST